MMLRDLLESVKREQTYMYFDKTMVFVFNRKGMKGCFRAGNRMMPTFVDEFGEEV